MIYKSKRPQLKVRAFLLVVIRVTKKPPLQIVKVASKIIRVVLIWLAKVLIYQYFMLVMLAN